MLCAQILNFGLRFDRYIEWSWSLILWPSFAMCVLSLMGSIAAIYYFSKLIIEVRFSEKAKDERERQKREEEARNGTSGEAVDGTDPDNESEEDHKKFKPSRRRFGVWYLYLTLGFTAAFLIGTICLSGYLETNDKLEMANLGFQIGLYPALYLFVLVIMTMCQFRHLEHHLSEFFSAKSIL
jgi:hypothetical protein